MKITIMKEVTFAGAHQLPFHEGKCKNLHGHEWKVRVYIERSNGGVIVVGPSRGMVMDFGDLKIILKRSVEDVLDHSLLNGRFENPTAENIAEWIMKELTRELKELAGEEFLDISVKRVEVWETPTSCAIVEGD